MTSYTVASVPGLGEVVPGADLAELVLSRTSLEDGDILVVTSKVVSKTEGRVVTASKAEALAGETDRVVARRGETTIVRTHHGLVMAGGGIDASNTTPGTLVLLPQDPDRSARRIRARIGTLSGRCVAVVISDTSGRAWRNGQTDIAIGAAGLRVLDDHAGRSDPYGNLLLVTAPALADEIAAAGDLAKGKVAMSPVAVVRGLAQLVMPPGDDGPGAAALVRDETADMFGLGAREAVMEALIGGDGRGFGGAAPTDTVVAAAVAVAGPAAGVAASSQVDEIVVDLGATEARSQGWVAGRLEAVARAHGWTARGTQEGDRVILAPRLP